MPRYRKRPVIIEAMQVPSSDQKVQWGRFAEWMSQGKSVWHVGGGRERTVEIRTLEGTMIGNPGDWIIRGVQDELYPCKPDIFKATYELVEAGEPRGRTSRSASPGYMPTRDYFIPAETLDKLWEQHRPFEGENRCSQCNVVWPCAIVRWLCDVQERWLNG